jgi:hypothetical protein
MSREIKKAKETYSVLTVDDLGNPSDTLNAVLDIDQNQGDELEVWKTREDGFLFVYCHRLEIGYWAHPELLESEK